ncbi:hypothetical protein Drorol1_Dr00011609 [Drosera rotundifolia]
MTASPPSSHNKTSSCLRESSNFAINPQFFRAQDTQGKGQELPNHQASLTQLLKIEPTTKQNPNPKLRLTNLVNLTALSAHRTGALNPGCFNSSYLKASAATTNSNFPVDFD